MLMEEQRGTTFLWCVQGDAAAGVEAVDEGRQRRSSGVLERCEEKEEDEKAKGGMERGPVALFIGLEA